MMHFDAKMTHFEAKMKHFEAKMKHFEAKGGKLAGQRLRPLSRHLLWAGSCQELVLGKET